MKKILIFLMAAFAAITATAQSFTGVVYSASGQSVFTNDTLTLSNLSSDYINFNSPSQGGSLMRFSFGGVLDWQFGFYPNGIQMLDESTGLVPLLITPTNDIVNINYGASISGVFSNQTWQSTTLDWYTSIGLPWTNPTGRRGTFTIPFWYTTTSGTPWGVGLFITNYIGLVGAAGTITNVVARGMGATGLTGLAQSGSNMISGAIGPSSVVVLNTVAGTITLLNVTNNQSSIDW